MLAIAAVDEVKDLLGDGYSQRAVARMTGVRRGTGHGIATGKRHVRDQSERVDLSPGPSGPEVRCPGCGGRVQLPCVACRTRATPTGESAPGDDVAAASLQLKTGDRPRYAKIQRRRLGEEP